MSYKNPHIMTWPGRRRINFSNLDPSEVSMTDLAHHLASERRWCGGTPEPYSVAQHSCMVSLLCEAMRGVLPAYAQMAPAVELAMPTARFAMHGLLHDSEEAYVRDLPTQLKHMPELAGYREVAKSVKRCVLTAYMGEQETPSIVKPFDRLAYEVEAVYLLHAEPEAYPAEVVREALGVFNAKWSKSDGHDTLYCWDHYRAKRMFLDRWRELVIMRNAEIDARKGGANGEPQGLPE